MLFSSALIPVVLGGAWMVQSKVVWDGRAPLDYGPLQLDTSSGPYLTYVPERLRVRCSGFTDRGPLV